MDYTNTKKIIKDKKNVKPVILVKEKTGGDLGDDAPLPTSFMFQKLIQCDVENNSFTVKIHILQKGWTSSSKVRLVSDCLFVQFPLAVIAKEWYSK